MRPSYRALVMSFALFGPLATILVGSSSAVPITGNLVITSGHAPSLGPCPGGLIIRNLSGPGFFFPSLIGELFTGFSSCGVFGRAGSPFGFHVNFAGTDAGHEATILGIRYSDQLAHMPGDVPLLPIGGINAFFTLGSGGLFPPVGDSSVTLVEPLFLGPGFFGPARMIEVAVLNGNVFQFNLVGEGTAALTLVPCTNRSFCDWSLANTEFNFGPTPIPEPATLLLFGTTAAGLGLARWRRRRAHAHAA